MKIFVIVFILTLFFGIQVQQYSGVNSALVTARAYNPQKCRTLFIIAAFILIFVAGCRYYVGADFGGYYHGYLEYANDLHRAFVELDEPGLRFVYKLAIIVWDDGAACIFAVAAVTLGLELRYVYKNTDQYLFALLLFFLIVWTACFNGVRQALAAAVLLIGFPYLKKGRFFPYLIVVLIAYLCHKSSILMLLVWFVCRRKVSPLNILLLCVATIVVLFSMDQVFQFTGWLLNDSTDTTSYLNNSYWTNDVNLFRVASHIAPAVFFLIMYAGKEKSPDVTFYLNLLVITALVSVATSNSTCLARMGLYVTPYLVIAIPELTKNLNTSNRRLISIVVVILYAVFFWREENDVVWQWMWNR